MIYARTRLSDTKEPITTTREKKIAAPRLLVVSWKLYSMRLQCSSVITWMMVRPDMITLLKFN